MAKWVDFKTVREHLHFRDVLAHYGMEGQGDGDQIKIICPFHDDHKPSCGINIVKQVYNCFACDAGGNALDFVANMEGFDPDKPVELRKAAMFAATTFGIEAALERPSKGPAAKAKAKPAAEPADKKPKQAKPASCKPVIANDNDDTAKPEERSGSKRAGNQPLTFTLKLDLRHERIEDRGFNPALTEEFGIGFANKGMMKERICFPIHNGEGELIAYSGRWAAEDLPDDVPRYLLPKRFEKSKALFNLHRIIAMREEQPELDTVVIVEGFWSVLRLHDEGVPCVASFGDSVSEAQVDLLVQAGFTRAILIFDGDEGGRTGTKSSLPILAERLFVKSVALADGIKPDLMDDELVTVLPHYH